MVVILKGVLMEDQTQPKKKWSPDFIAGIVLVVMFLMGVAFILYIRSQETDKVRIYFDNGLDKTIVARYDGEAVATAPAHSAIEVWLPVGTHTIKILGENGDLIEETPAAFPPVMGITANRWVYNVSTANEYIMRFIPFGNAKPEEPQVLGAGKRYFELPNISPVFAPEGGIPTKGKAGTNMALVLHSKVHPDGKCCQSIREFVEGPQK